MSNTVFNHHPQEKRLVEVEDQENPNESNPVLTVEGLDFPIKVSKWIFEESGKIFVSSPFLGHISGFTRSLNKLSEVSICFLGKRSKKKSGYDEKKGMNGYLPIMSARSLMFGTP